MNAPLGKGRWINADGTRARGDSPVRRFSYDIDDIRARPWQPIGNGTVADACRWRDALVRSIEEWNVHNRVAGKGVPLPGGAIRVLRALLYSNLLDFRTGELDPPLNLIAKIAGCAKGTVVTALDRLRDLGIIDWVRRSRRTGYSPGEGPTRKQETNAYYFPLRELPKRLRLRFQELLQRQRRKAGALAKAKNNLKILNDQMLAEDMRNRPPTSESRQLQDTLDSLIRMVEEAEPESNNRSVCPPEANIQKE